MTALLAAIAAGAAIVTATINIVRGWVDPDHAWPNWALDLSALAIGVGYALGWQIDVSGQAFLLVPALARNSARLQGVAGQVLTGLAFGAGATFAAKVLNMFGAIQVKNQALAEPRVAPPRK